ncbi:MAG: hypothetical protein AAF226_05235 [Verrucomicrobiota bacterium]
MKTVLTLLIVVASLAGQIVQAGVSVPRSHIDQLLDRQPDHKSHLNSLLLPNSADATRLGKHFGPLAGTPVGPYRLDGAKPDGTLISAIIKTQWYIADQAGRNLGQEPAQGDNLMIVESIQDITIVPRQKSTTPNSQGYTPSSGEPSGVKSVRAVYNSVESLNLDWQELSPAQVDIEFVTLKKGTAQSAVRKATLIYGMGDHASFDVQGWYDKQGQLAFALATTSSWGFVGPDQTEDTLTEHRLYFQDGQIIYALEKSYKYREEAQAASAAKNATNRPIPVGGQSAAKYFQHLMKLPQTSIGQAFSLAEEIWKTHQEIAPE